MVDKIYSGKGFSPVGSASYASKANAVKKSDSAAKPQDSVDFSSALQSATKAQETSTMQQSARAERIQNIKSQIEDGSYQPDLEKVATSLLPVLMQDA
jgi:negative regulator of flagellin synthesis FlgM